SERGRLLVEEIRRNQTTSTGPKIRLYLGLPENSVVTDLIASLSELGIDEVSFFCSDRAQKPKARVKNWQSSDRVEKIALEAERQSERLRPMKIEFLDQTLEEILKQELAELGRSCFCFDEADEKGNSSSAVVTKAAKICGFL